MDSNPYKSPPPALLAEGIATVMMYIKIRMKRIDTMYNLILKRYGRTSTITGCMNKIGIGSALRQIVV